MNHISKHRRRVAALFLALITAFSLLPTAAFAGQEDGYHDPAEHWIISSNRTGELDVNATVTHETIYCVQCGKNTSFTVWRTPEYTRDGQTALLRNVKYSDGTTLDGEGTGTILDGVPGANASYTGCHWTKVCCDTCGTMNSSTGITDYAYGKNVYWVYDCAAEFTQELDETVSYEYADAAYHTKTVSGGTYCAFCYGTRHTRAGTLERHTLTTTVTPDTANHRFTVTERCALCGYETSGYLTAKTVVASYFGSVDGQAHTLTLADLSDAGVSTSIRYGNSAASCTMTSAPSYTTEGQNTVYYAVTYSYGGERMTENGVAYVWLRDESTGNCACGCGDTDCGCVDSSCTGNCHSASETHSHNYTLLDAAAPTCTDLGYDRYLCPDCGDVEKRNYVAALGHAYTGVTVSEADCEHDGKYLEICSRCGDTKVTTTPKAGHSYIISSVAAACASPGYTVKECFVCGERVITNLTEAAGHRYLSFTTPAACEHDGKVTTVCADCGQIGTVTVIPAAGHDDVAVVTPPTCITGGYTTHTCSVCGESHVDSHTDPVGHSWDDGTIIRDATCAEGGLVEYRCAVCGVTRLEDYGGTGGSTRITLPAISLASSPISTVKNVPVTANSGSGHTYVGSVTAPTCTERGFTTFVCVDCGDSYISDLTAAQGHNYKALVTAPTCDELGYTTYTCARCGDSYRSDYVETLAHNYKAVVTAPTCSEGGYTTFTCTRCGDSYVGNHTSVLGHDWKAPVILASNTCDSDGVLEYNCARCDAHYHEAISAKGHRPGPAATCNNPQTCLDCGAVLAPATSHNYKKTVIAPTCTELGYTAYACVNCGNSYKSDYVRETGHHYEAGVTAPTCTEGGYTTYVCSGCGDTYVDDDTDPLGHDWSGPELLVNGTCNGDGLLEYNCSRCNAHYHEAVSATGHNPGPAADCGNPQTCLDCGAVLAPAAGHDYKAAVTPATCLKMGCTTYTCVNCGDSYRSDYTEPLGHDYKAVVTAPTCTGRGYTAHTCAHCGDSYIDSYTEAAGHRLDAGKVLTPAVCAHNGVVQHFCLDCDYTTLETIPATGHNPGPVATCDEPQVCIDCGTILAPATGHNYKAVVTAPTCNALGYTTYTCADCGDSYKSDYVEAAGHKTGGWMIDAEPTAEAEGSRHRECLTCHAVLETERIEKLAARHEAYIVGYEDGSFRPENSMTRAEAATIFARLLAEKKGDTIPTAAKTGFADVPTNAWYSGYVKYLVGSGVVNGVGGRHFEPDRGITRAEFVVMAVRFFEAYGDGGEIVARDSVFTDVTRADWAVAYIREAALRGWIIGYEDGTFRPGSGITRAEVVAVVNRMLSRAADRMYIADHARRLETFTDMPQTHWAYCDVTEAANTHSAVLTDAGETWSR